MAGSIDIEKKPTPARKDAAKSPHQGGRSIYIGLHPRWPGG